MLTWIRCRLARCQELRDANDGIIEQLLQENRRLHRELSLERSLRDRVALLEQQTICLTHHPICFENELPEPAGEGN